MNLGKIITRVQREFGDESESEISRQDIIDWVNEGQIEIVKATKSLMIHKETAVEEGQTSYILPADAIFVDRVTFSGRPLTPTTQEYIDSISTDGANTSGNPSHYYIYGRELFIFPGPTDVGEGLLDIWYSKIPTVLSENSHTPEIPEHLHSNLITYALARAKGMDEEYDQSSNLMGGLKTALSEEKDNVDSLQDDSYPAVRLLPGD